MMVSRKDCPLNANIGGNTKFVADVNCADLEENNWSLDVFDSILMPGENDFIDISDNSDEAEGCCYNYGMGWNGVSYGPCCQNAHELQPENGMLGASSCPIEQRTGGNTEFVEGVTCEEFEEMGWVMSEEPAPTPDPDLVKQGAEGCCYNVGFGAMMAECCQSAHDLQPANGMLGAELCPTDNMRMGGETRFQEGVTCEEFEAMEWTMEAPEESGCCYNVGFGAMMMECCQIAHDSQPENGLLGASDCPVGDRLGGATKFQGGLTCEEFESMEWTMEEPRQAATYDDHKKDAKRKRTRGDCVGVGGKWSKKGKCKPRKLNKFRCAKIKNEDACDKYGCEKTQGRGRFKCRGSP